jgi:hypothetical protein
MTNLYSWYLRRVNFDDLQVPQLGMRIFWRLLRESDDFWGIFLNAGLAKQPWGDDFVQLDKLDVLSKSRRSIGDLCATYFSLTAIL